MGWLEGANIAAGDTLHVKAGLHVAVNALHTVLLVCVLSLHTSRSSSTKGAVEGKVNVLLAVHPHNEGWHIHNLLANPVTMRDSVTQ